MGKLAGSIGLLGWLLAFWMMAGLASAQDVGTNWAGCMTVTPTEARPIADIFQTATAAAQGTVIVYPPYPTASGQIVSGQQSTFSDQRSAISGQPTLAPEFQYKVVWSNGVNVRRGAGTYYDIIAAVPPEATVTAVGTPTGYVGGYRWINRKEGGWMAIDSL